MKLLFIEPVNVLTTIANFKRLLEINPRVTEEMYEQLDQRAVNLLKEVLEKADVHLVVCGEWRHCPTKTSALFGRLKVNGITLDDRIIAIIPFAEARGISKQKSMQDCLSRLRKNRIITKVASLDSNLNSEVLQGETAFFTVDPDKGLTQDLADLMVEYFN